MPKYSHENNTSNIHGNFSFQYTEALSRHFNTQFVFSYLYLDTNFVFFTVIVFLCVHTYNINDLYAQEF